MEMFNSLLPDTFILFIFYSSFCVADTLLRLAEYLERPCTFIYGTAYSLQT